MGLTVIRIAWPNISWPLLVTLAHRQQPRCRRGVPL
jgi:hypothetical protein